MPAGPSILHADLDAFYASVEQLLDPSLRGRPVAVGGGVVLAASYEAKRFGVQGGMPGRRAQELCPDLVFVQGHFREYQRLADRVMAVLEDVTPLVQRISIDEAFLDVSGARNLFGAPEVIARRIRSRVRSEIGLPISVGAARTKHLAKIASQVAKPDGLVVVDPADEQRFLDPLPVGLIWGIGPVAQRRLAERGIRTIGELAAASPDGLRSVLGTALAGKVTALAANEDARRVERPRRSSSIGAQSALGRQEPDPELVRQVVGHLADRVATRLRAAGRGGRTVTVRIRFADLRSVTRSCTLGAPVSSTLTLTEVAERLVHAALADHPGERHVSLLAVSVGNLLDESTAVQLELPLGGPGVHDPAPTLRPGSPADAARAAVDRSVDQVRRCFGRGAVGFASVVLSDVARVPDEFRELAERQP